MRSEDEIVERTERTDAAAVRIQRAFRRFRQKPEEEKSALREARILGEDTRRHYRVKSVAGAPGVIHTQVTGRSEHFERVGIHVAEREVMTGAHAGAEHQRTLNILSIDRAQYRGGVAGGDALRPSAVTAAHASEIAGTPTVFINASYFNYGADRDKERDEYLPIGETIAGGARLESLAVPKAYQADYKTIRFSDSGDKITTGPLLAGPSYFLGRLEAKFSAARGRKNKYRYRDSEGRQFRTSGIPGYLHHAGDPNDRAGISWPKAGKEDSNRYSPKQNRVRLFTVRTTTGRGGGFSMPELSAAATRITAMNQHPAAALNLDGGGSASMGVALPDGRVIAKSGYHDRTARAVSSIITYQHRGS